VLRLGLAFVLLTSALAWAEAPVDGNRTSRSVGRAGVGMVSDDGGGALLVNPAAIARREAARMQVGVLFIDDEMYWLQSLSSPAARDQSSSRLLPMLAVEGAIGDWIVGASIGTTAHSERLLRRPGRIPQSEYGNAFEYRYDGLGGSIRRDTIALGVSRRVTDTVAIGLSVAGSRVAVSELRRIWMGNDALEARDPTQVPGDPAQDAELGMSGAGFAPTVTAGVLVAPEDSSIELGASASWSGPARARGDVGGSVMGQGHLDFGSTNARIEVEQPIALHTGARWLAERWSVEIGGDLWIVPKRAGAPLWRFDDVRVVDTTIVGSPRDVALASLPSRLSTRTHGALRAALDLELMPGFLWATSGYAFTTAGTADARLSPTFGDLGGHTAAIGVEASVAGITITFGVARTWSVKEHEPVSRWRLDNPFGTGDAEVPAGTYDGSVDVIGLSIDAELWAPD
jgi:hypothetical protein